jgi:peptide/nickel transport system permease protein
MAIQTGAGMGNLPLEEAALAPGQGFDGPSGGEGVSTGSIGMQILRVFFENKLAVIGAAVIILMVLFCYLGPVFYSTNQTNANNALLYGCQNCAPSWAHPLGTVGFAAAGLATAIGVIWGAVSGFFGGWVDALMMRIVDVLLSVPLLFLIITLAVIFKPSLSLIILVIGFTAWLGPARLVRGEALTLRVREYVQAVRVMGGTGRRIVVRHIIPNTIGTIVVNATFQVADAILLMAALGFIGLGVPLPLTDWGSMLANAVNWALAGYWWQIYPTGAAIVLVVVAFNFVGDALRDAFEVRLQRR